MLIASALGHRFSILVGRKKWIPKMHENVVNYGLLERLASFESVDLGVEDFQKNKEETERRLTEAAQRAVEEKLAEVIILGCGLQYGFYQVLQKKLGRSGHRCGGRSGETRRNGDRTATAIRLGAQQALRVRITLD